MKFWIKLVLCIILSITTILSLSRFIVIRQNFYYEIKNTIDKNIMQNTMEKYFLEQKIINDIEATKEITKESIKEYVKDLYSIMQTDLERIALFSETQELIYTNMESNLIQEIKTDNTFSKDTDIYYIKKINDWYVMVFSSYWEINNETIYVVNIYDITNIYKERDRQVKDMRICRFNNISSFFNIYINIINIYNKAY